MDVALLEEGEYTPEWNGNQEDAKPIVVLLRPLTAAQRGRCMQVSFDENGQGAATPDYVEAVRVGVKEIRNLMVGGKPVIEGRALLASQGIGLDQLVVEIGAEIIRRNRTPDLKN